MTSSRARFRAYGFTIGTLPTGPHNAITDVPGVRVGHHTVWHEPPQHPAVARTGVTVIWPATADPFRHRLYAGTFVLNGYGEMTSRTIIDEWGLLSSPIFLTSSMAVGTVYDAAVRHFIERDPAIGHDDIFQPVVAECDDSYLSDSRAMPITRDHVEAALASLTSGPVPEGSVGAGTGMHAFQFKGGIGTSSRLVATATETFAVGVLTLTNFGRQPRLTVAGAPVGLKLRQRSSAQPPEGSAIVVVATDAPLHPLQCARLAKRAALGLARTGSTGSDGSGELVLAFSTGQVISRGGPGAFHTVEAPHEGPFIWSGDTLLNQLFEAVVDATEESVLNALFRADSTSGRDGHRLDALPLDDALDILAAHGHPAARP